MSQTVLTYTQNILQSLDDAEQQIATAKSWEARFRTLMLLGKALPDLPRELQVDVNLVQGCESKVWLTSEQQEELFYFAIGSNAKIVKGLLLLLMLNINGKTAEEIELFDFSAYLEKLNILGQLSSSRTNGLTAIVEQIRTQINRN